MDRDVTIDKINAYRKLLENRKLPKGDSGIEQELNREFESWVQRQLDLLLGRYQDLPKDTATERLTDDEIRFVRNLFRNANKQQERALAPRREPLATNTETDPSKTKPQTMIQQFDGEKNRTIEQGKLPNRAIRTKVQMTDDLAANLAALDELAKEID